ncbi:putative ABC transporter [Neospora caninum Liverpool]|uniref:ABC transporter, putative n=1 Tax=Neospora caninum (strain Liverpool) TaxID=572307 RepID=F0V834_NEOCL|nr:putative ABC transporter [Neospora caninum Liverpool]CBZ49875.1 putative ABC transporter [Neospora caninum Liverpool]CEL64464.1 TPA: ABC transporter, putative [Neospora caninum Liverpool]|eukprot:XP_003879910.1 putative ABC transporter [Neospora caninum Liverpool]
MPGVLSKDSSSPDAPASRASLLLALFRRFCPDKTRKRLFLAMSSLILCSSCNLATPTLLGIAIDAASNSAAASAGHPARGHLAATGGATLQGAGLFGGIGSVLSGVCTAVGQVLRGGGKEALKNQPPKVLFTLIAAVICVGAVASFVRTSQLETAEHEMRVEVRRQLFRTLLYMPPSLFLFRSPGHLLPLFLEDTEALVSAFTQTHAQALRYTSSVVGGSSLLLLISPRVTALALVLLPLAGCSAMLLAKRLRRLRGIREKEVQECTAFLSDRLFHVKTVYIHQEQEQELFRLQSRQDQALEAAKAAAIANGCFFGGLSFSINSTVLALLTYGTTLVKRGVLSYGSLTTFAVYSSMVGVGFSGLTAVFSELARAAEAGERLHAVLSLGDGASALAAAGDRAEGSGNTLDTAETAARLPLVRKISEYQEGRASAGQVAEAVVGEIAFANVSFSYAGTGDFQEGLAQASPLASLVPSLAASPAEARSSSEDGGEGAMPETGEGVETPEPGAGATAVKNISFVVPAGSLTAITGASGSGKSTLLKLLTKQIHPQQGTITLDGADVQAIPTRLLLQKLLGVVNNESTPLLTGLSVRENVMYGLWTPPGSPPCSHLPPRTDENRPGVTPGEAPSSSSASSSGSLACSEELFAEVCRLCNIDQFLSAPNISRENMLVEGTNAGFSTGEQQRLGLARALIKNAAVLVLDEATAHLDAENERVLLHTLRRVLRKDQRLSESESEDDREESAARLLKGAVKTVVLIAHSKAALQMADTVVVLKEGEIVESGPFDALIKNNGELTRLLKLQGEPSGEDTSERGATDGAEAPQLVSQGSWWWRE